MFIGCHLSSSDGYYKMGVVAKSIGANTFQFFTRNPRGAKSKPLNIDDCRKLNDFLTENKFGNIIAHAPYTLNPASSDERVSDFARTVFKEDLKILENIPTALYNFHPGNHVGAGESIGIERCIETLNEVLDGGDGNRVLIECMAGKGTEIGRSFEQIRKIIDGVENKKRVGVCLDTCHISDGGYDVIENFSKILDELDEIIGLNLLCAVHLNDSMNERGAKKDRHAKIGEGKIGCEAIKKIVNEPRLAALPFVLETPNDLDGYKNEIAMIKAMKN